MKPHQQRATFYRVMQREAKRRGDIYMTKGKCRKAWRLFQEGK